MTWAFSDESERAANVYFGVLFIEPGAVAASRRELRNLLLPGQRRVHTAKESARRRRALLDVVPGLEAESIVFTLRRPAGLPLIRARELLVASAAEEVIERRVASWHFDRQEPRQAARDRQVVEKHVRRTGHQLVYDHRPAAEEPLLWAIDAVLWAAAVGGDWRRRVGESFTIVQVEP